MESGDVWKIKPWPFPIGDFRRPYLVRLLQDREHTGDLELILAEQGSNSRKARLVFKEPYLHRNLDEFYFNSLIPEGSLPKEYFQDWKHPWFWICDDSNFIRSIGDANLRAWQFRDGYAAYVIITENDVIEVVAASPPTIGLIEPVAIG